MAQPIMNPPVPYVCPIDGGFGPGRLVKIQGFASPNGDRFNINFQTRPTTFEQDDIAFHISVRLLQGYIARNSFRYGLWEEEEDYGELPIQPGQRFEILILCEPAQFKVAVNGRHYCDFRHRIPYTSISHFGVDGDVTLSLISFEGGAPTAAAPMYAPQPGAYGAPPPSYGQMPGQMGMPSAPPPYAQAVSMPPVNQAPPHMGMPGGMSYAPGYQYPPM